MSNNIGSQSFNCRAITKNGHRCTNTGLYDGRCGIHHNKVIMFDPRDRIATILYRQFRQGAKKRKIVFWLREWEIKHLLVKSGGRCMVTNVPFDYSESKGKKRPYFPSIDRIDSSKGYYRNNCRIVIAAANIAMNVWGEEVIYRMAECMIEAGFMTDSAIIQ